MLAGDLARDLAFGLDPVRVAVEMGLPPDPWQTRFLRSPGRRILLNCSRQSGKSTVTALLAAHTALYDPGALVLLLSPTQRQSHELFRKALDAYRAIPTAVPLVQESALRLELENGSRIVSLPGKEETVRGYSGVRLLAVDEAARVPDSLYYSVRPMLAVSGGRLVALSTPFGTRGWWYETWRSEEPWERFRVPAEECPRISAEFLDEERRTMGEWWYAQEYECEFLDAETQPFGRERRGTGLRGGGGSVGFVTGGGRAFPRRSEALGGLERHFQHRAGGTQFPGRLAGLWARPMPERDAPR